MTESPETDGNRRTDAATIPAAAEQSASSQAAQGAASPDAIDALIAELTRSTMSRSPATPSSSSTKSDANPRKNDNQATEIASIDEYREKSYDERAGEKSKTTGDAPSAMFSGSVPQKSGARATVSSFPGSGNRWIDAPQQLRVLTYQIILDEGGETYRFTVNLSHHIVARAKMTKKTLSTWVNGRLSHALKPLEEKLGAKLLFWFTIEVSENDITHIHGAIGIAREHLPELRKALRQVSGIRTTVVGAKQFFVHVTAFDDAKSFDGLHGSLGWVNYAVKDLERTAKLSNIGSPIVCRRLLNQRARTIWPAIRTGHWLHFLADLKPDDGSLAA